MTYIDSGAQLSPCQRYRYTLWRVWDEAAPMVAFVGLNPSTADATEDDPTIRRCIRFAQSHGYGALTMLNLFALRATNPNVLRIANWLCPEEAENLATIGRLSDEIPRFVAAWGNHPMGLRRRDEVTKLVREWWCLGRTKDGEPRHPLYLPNTATMTKWSKD